MIKLTEKNDRNYMKEKRTKYNEWIQINNIKVILNIYGKNGEQFAYYIKTYLKQEYDITKLFLHVIVLDSTSTKPTSFVVLFIDILCLLA